MASPQTEDGFLKIANELVVAFSRINLSPYESRIVWCVIRKTYGWGKRMDRISLSQFAKEVGIDRKSVHRTIRGLILKNIIVVSGATTRIIKYGIQKNYELWKVSSPKPLSGSRATNVSPGEPLSVVAGEPPTKETITKETSKDIYIGILTYLKKG